MYLYLLVCSLISITFGKQWKSFTSSDLEFIDYSPIDLICGDDADICNNIGTEQTLTLPGVSVFDCNNDGFDDVIFPATNTGDYAKLFMNSGLNDFDFREESFVRGLNTAKPSFNALTIDIDNDGWIDIIFSDSTYLLQIFHNDGDCMFTDITLQTVPYLSLIQSVQGTSGIGGLLSAGDYDHDGDLDIIQGSIGNNFPRVPYSVLGVSILWTNELQDDGTRQFIPAMHPPIIPYGIGFACQPSFEDFDEDGWDDIIISQCPIQSGGHTVFWKNVPYSIFDPTTIGNPLYDDKRIFIEVSNAIEPFGVYGSSKGLSMTHTFGDYDKDTHFDIFMSDMGASFQIEPVGSLQGNNEMLGTILGQYPVSKPWLNFASRFFKPKFHGDELIRYDEIINEIGIDVDETGWGGLLIDLDNDGWDDIIHQGNFLGIGRGTNPGFVYKNIRKTKIRAFKLMNTLSLEGINSYGIAYGDFNNDGFVDITISTKPITSTGLISQPFIYKNNGLNNVCDGNGITRNYLDVELRGNGIDSNYYGINLLIEVSITKLRYFQIGKIRAGTNWAGSNANYAHFGIPIKVKDCNDDINFDEYKADITVYWKGMNEDYKECYHDIQINQRVILNQSV